MADSSIIKEFLVKLGYQVEETSWKKFEGGVARATAGAKTLGLQAVATAAAVVASVTKIADQYEELYFAALKTGSSIAILKSHSYASKAIGISSEQAAAGLEELNLQMQMNPGKRALAEMLGVKTAGRETAVVYRDLVGVFEKMSKQGPFGFAVASRYAEQFGMSPSELLRRIQLRKEEAEAAAEYQQKLRDSGVNTEALGDQSRKLNKELRSISANMGLMSDQVAERWMPTMTAGVVILKNWTELALRAGKETGGLSTSILSLVAGVVSLKGIGWLLRLLGLGAAGGVVGAAGGVVAAGTFFAGSVLPSEAGDSSLKGDSKPASSAELQQLARERDEAARKKTLWKWLFGEDEKGGSAVAPPPQSTGGSRSSGRSSVMDYFVKKGWSREAAAGLAANMEKESGFDHRAVGDGGKAYGVFQWHPDRQAEFSRWSGKDIRKSTLQEQLDFAHYELTQGREKRAGDRLRDAKSAAGAGAVVSSDYLRPAGGHGEAMERARMARDIFGASLAPGGQGGTTTVNNTVNTNVHVSEAKDAKETGAAVRREVDSSNAELVRQTQAVVR